MFVPESNRYTVNKLLLNDIIVVEYYILDVEIIFSLMKIVEGMSIKGVSDPE